MGSTSDSQVNFHDFPSPWLLWWHSPYRNAAHSSHISHFCNHTLFLTMVRKATSSLWVWALICKIEINYYLLYSFQYSWGEGLFIFSSMTFFIEIIFKGSDADFLAFLSSMLRLQFHSSRIYWLPLFNSCVFCLILKWFLLQTEKRTQGFSYYKFNIVPLNRNKNCHLGKEKKELPPTQK